MRPLFSLKQLVICLCIGFFALIGVKAANAQIIKTYTVNMELSCLDEEALVVIDAGELPSLLGQQLEQLSVFTLSQASLLPDSLKQEQLQSVLFQIDQKDAQDRYIIMPESKKFSGKKAVLGSKDELVIRKKDLGTRLSKGSDIVNQYTLLEIEVRTSQKDEAQWFYINIGPVQKEEAGITQSVLAYNQELDVVSGPVYKTGFSHTKPFLVDSFQWRLAEAPHWSDDFSDMMKIRHNGKFLGLSFKRSQDDYHSNLVGVKKGPLRIIRRTENRVKVFWKLKTPALYIDYIMMPDGFVMDTIIDIPFKISLFFSGLETLTTMDWNHTADLPELTIHSGKNGLSLPVNGRQTLAKKVFNQIEDTRFSVSSELGTFDVSLLIPDNFPIQAKLYLNDALNEEDFPENYPGQFGNVGFRTTGWEDIDSKLYHLKFTVCMRGVRG